MASKSQRSTLHRAQEEIQDLLLDLQSGTLDRITLEAGLKQVQERLKAMEIHGYWAEPEPEPNPDQDPGAGRGPNLK
jgi:hypothetical protein